MTCVIKMENKEISVKDAKRELGLTSSSDKEVRRSKGAVNGTVKPKGCGKMYDKHPNISSVNAICGSCGICPKCSKENNLKVASLCENCGFSLNVHLYNEAERIGNGIVDDEICKKFKQPKGCKPKKEV